MDGADDLEALPLRRRDDAARRDRPADEHAAAPAAPAWPRDAARSSFSLDRSPLARKIILFNLLAIIGLVVGVLLLNPARDSLLIQREQGLVNEARLIAGGVEAALAADAAPTLSRLAPVVAALGLPRGVEVKIYDREGVRVATATGSDEPVRVIGLTEDVGQTSIVTTVLNAAWEAVTARRPAAGDGLPSTQAAAQALVDATPPGAIAIRSHTGPEGQLYTIAVPIEVDGSLRGTIAVTTRSGEVDALARVERERLLQIFVIALIVSVALSLVLASTIANPLADLSAAAELGRDRDAGRLAPRRVRIPDLTDRPDEIGRLSAALRGMVGALYDRIDSNEQFAADVAHEIKNPLASLRSAVGTIRLAREDAQRAKLLDVIEHDVRRLDRLVSDISNASRLDSELVRDEEEPFDLVRLIDSLATYHAAEAKRSGIDLIMDLPREPVVVMGLEARLAQVIVNLLANALSFCEPGDAVRIWLRRRSNRVLIVVEDTGPGIPDEALGKIFSRFYSERPERQFGDHSGLGLAISRQIVEAHGGVIWAENIRPTEHDATSDPLGARFVVGLTV